MNNPSSSVFPLAFLLAGCVADPGETGFVDSETGFVDSEACTGNDSSCQENGTFDSNGEGVQQEEDAPSQDSLDPEFEESIRSVVRRYKGQVKYCYDNRLVENPEIEGRIEVYFALAGGRIEDTQIVYNTTGDTQLADCIRNKVQRWRFDSDIYLDVIFPFILTVE